MSVSQSDFRAALLDPARAAPAGLTDPQGRPAGSRFDVYRNNVAVSLAQALEQAFPAVRKLVGDEFFKAMAGVYLRRHQPETPLLMLYGASFPRFIARFEPARSLPYLADVARLEQAIRESYHEADAPACAPEALQALPGGNLMAARLSLVPAVRLVRSRWPVFDIWSYNIRATAPPASPAPQDILITRPEFDPEPVLLPPGGFEFVTALARSGTFGTALAAAQAEAPGFDLAGVLSLMIRFNVIAEITSGRNE